MGGGGRRSGSRYTSRERDFAISGKYLPALRTGSNELINGVNERWGSLIFVRHSAGSVMGC